MGITRLWYNQEDDTIRLVIDFRRINQCLKQKEYTLPTIEEILQEISGFMLASVVDLNMGYLSIPLCTESRKLLTNTTHYGFIDSCVLPMGIKPASNIFQLCMVGVFQPMTVGKPRAIYQRHLQWEGQYIQGAPSHPRRNLPMPP